jgi:hypothetical protein
LIKHHDRYASDGDIAAEEPRSVVSKRILAEIAIQEGGDVRKAATGDPPEEIRKLLKNPQALARPRRRKPSVWHSKAGGAP